ncbi:hypothetical protein KKH27_14580 [bacterium]|nr:hypothetical protein [bacterium]MBU1983340.1 hypothetical protein [bacterium]
MKRFAWILPIIVLGSLWGLVEILPISIPIMIAAGVLFLTLGRRMVNVPGTSMAMGLVVCLLKTYAINFHLCNLSGILSVAVSFDVLASLVWRQDVRTLPAAAVRGALTCALALPLFVGAVLAFRHPYWVAGGWARIVDYAVRDILPALLLSLVVAPLGLIVARRLTEPQRVPRWVVPIFSAGAVVFAWLAATVRFVERVL